MPDLSYWGRAPIWKNPTEGARTPSTAFLSCKCGKRYWSTKNIGYIGARNIFFLLGGGCDWMKALATFEPECQCPIGDLSIDEELMEHVAECPECTKYGF